MNDAWTDRLSEYADGSLVAEERALIEAHLGTCAPCATALGELRAVMERARTLPVREPETDLWPGIEARIAAFARETHEGAERAVRPRAAHAGGAPRSFPGTRGGFVLSFPQLAAAALALVTLSGGITWFAARNAAPAGVASGGDRAATTDERGAATPAANDGGAAVTGGELAGELQSLEEILAAKRSELDPETVKTIETNLKIIDLATSQAQQALADDPANPYLKEHLEKTMKRKIEMLKQATVLASAQ